jgi:putative component of toxin-antitoxin plasmid stabilization module
MNEEEKGWRAFPMVFEKIVGEGMKEINIQKGMTIRDYFAAKAMQGLFSCGKAHDEHTAHVTAKASYLMADAMLKARGEQ